MTKMTDDEQKLMESAIMIKEYCKNNFCNENCIFHTKEVIIYTNNYKHESHECKICDLGRYDSPCPQDWKV